MKLLELRLTYIVNGLDVEVTAYGSEPLYESRDEALRASGNTGRPVDDWVIRDIHGVTLPPSERVEKFNLVDGTRFFLMPAVGAGGA